MIEDLCPLFNGYGRHIIDGGDPLMRSREN